MVVSDKKPSSFINSPAVSTTAFTVIVAVAKSFLRTTAVASDVTPVITVSSWNSPVAPDTFNILFEKCVNQLVCLTILQI